MLVETCGFQPCSTKVQHREWQPPGTANHQQVRLSKGKKNSKNFQADFGDLYRYQLNESDHISSICNPEASGHFEDNDLASPWFTSTVSTDFAGSKYWPLPYVLGVVSCDTYFDDAQAKQWGGGATNNLISVVCIIISGNVHLWTDIWCLKQIHIEPNS